MAANSGRFNGWREMILTPLVELVILGGASLGVYLINHHFSVGLFGGLLLFYALQALEVVVLLKLVRLTFPKYFCEGTFATARDNSRAYLCFSLYHFLLIANLNIQFMNFLIPPPLRSGFYRLLGAKFGPGIHSIGGVIADPHFVTLGAHALVGDGALILGHVLSVVNGRDFLTFGRVEIGEGAIVGARSVVLPNASIGKYSMVNAHSVVASGTIIPAFEVWGGNPAIKISSSRSHLRPTESAA